MQKIFRFFLASGRRRRCLLAGVALRLLRALHEIESEEAQQYSDRLDCLDYDGGGDSRREYLAVEDVYINCEHAANTLESVIEDLEFLY
jgi:hypothetical protein